MRLRKYHGLGNDYLVLETAGPLTAGLVRALCDRHTGVGGDGVLEPLSARRGDDGRLVSEYAVRIWNPDGSRAEKSGNGLRILARWLRDQRAAPPAFTVEVRTFDDPGEQVACRVDPPASTGLVTVQMGRARFAPDEVPCALPLRDTPVPIVGHTLRLTAVGTGNPHCVVFLDQPGLLDSAPWRTWGAVLETHTFFPNRTNVQFAALAEPRPDDPPGLVRIQARVWERGAGETLASGSSACAIAAAAVRLGRAREQVLVEMPGGELAVDVAADGQLTLRGPVEEVGLVEVSATWLAARS